MTGGNATVYAAPDLRRAGPATQLQVVLAALAGLAILTGAAGLTAGWRHGLLALIGAGAGIALYHASFGFTSAWRRMLSERRSLGLRVQVIMIGLTIAVFFPLLAQGSFLGQRLEGFVNPVGLALCVGAFVFGIGMQLGGGCGSGTLYTAGGGSSRMVATLLAFIVGSLIATADPLGWSTWPDIGAHGLVKEGGSPWVALGIAAGLVMAAYAAAGWLEKSRHGAVQALPRLTGGNLLHGPWTLLAGALALVAVNIATLIVAGRPWGITAAFALWGAKAAQAFGIDVSAWPYWQGDPSLGAPVLADATSVMNFGLMLGALAAAGLAGKFAPQRRLPMRSLAAALLGGLLMGVGARLATGCNIGALFSGLASGSLHGLVWLLFAIPGNAIGARLRPAFRLD